MTDTRRRSASGAGRSASCGGDSAILRAGRPAASIAAAASLSCVVPSPIPHDGQKLKAGEACAPQEGQFTGRSSISGEWVVGPYSSSLVIVMPTVWGLVDATTVAYMMKRSSVFSWFTTMVEMRVFSSTSIPACFRATSG
jgi:hypothetical protein